MILAVTVGLPLSGKSTWVDNNCAGFNIVCPDDIRSAMGREFDLRIEPFVWAVAETQVRALLERDRNVIVDATNVSRWERAKWADLGKQYGARRVAYKIETPAQVCMDRAQEADRFHMVPVIHKMIDKFQWLNEDEGFERIYIDG